jgi:CHAT domain-containing protein/tetratricopeptide (TPR) repeat protein
VTTEQDNTPLYVPPGTPVGDALLAKWHSDPAVNVNSFFTMLEDETAEDWDIWLSVTPDVSVERLVIYTQALSITYRDRDRRLGDALRWAGIHLRLARSLPESFGPRSSTMGYGRDHYIYTALSGTARLENMRGAVEREFALLKEAEAHYHAEQDARRRDDVHERPIAERILGVGGGLSDLYRDLSKAAWRLGDEEQARRYHLLSVDHRLDERSAPSEAAELIMKGRYWMDMNHPDRALEHFQRAITLSETEQMHHPQVAADAYDEMARAYHRLGIPRTALKLAEKARSLMADSGKSGFLAAVEMTSARITAAHRRLGDPLAHLLRALDYHSAVAEPGAAHTWTAPDGRVLQIIDFEDAFGVLLFIADVLKTDGQLGMAADYLVLATQIAETVRSGAVDEASRIAVQEQRSEALTELVRVRLDLYREHGTHEFGDLAWQTLETLRARTFLDMAGETDLRVPAEVGADLRARERELLDRRRRLRSSPGRDTGFWAAHQAVEQQLTDVWTAMSQTSRAAAEYVAVRQARPASHVEVAEVLGETPPGSAGRVVVVNLFFPDDETLVLLAVGRGDTHVRVASSRVDRRRLARFTAANFGSADRVREMATDIEELFQHGFGPVVAPLADLCEPGDTVIVCPTGPIHNIPLGAVKLGDDALITRNPLVISPSASLLRSRRLAETVSGRVGRAVFGDPNGDLPSAQREAIERAAAWGVPAHLGAAATADALSTALSSSDGVHVAAHAGFDAKDPLASAIRMSDRELTAKEILGIHAARLDLVTLSACESGIYHAERSEDPMGLPRALLFAGASSVLVSLWKVDDEWAHSIMSGFYKAMSNGVSKAEALRSATLAVREQDERLDRWAGFVLIGSRL